MRQNPSRANARTPRFVSHTVLSFAAFGLAACGGGGGGGGDGGGIVVVPPPPPANNPPALTGNLSPSFSENSDVLFTLNVEDADGDTVTITIGNSADGQFFTLETATGEIRGTQQFDFENPLDADGDNVYVQQVTLDDGTDTVETEVRVIITNLDEPPMCDVIPDTSVDENVDGVIAQFTGTDPDAGDNAIAVWEFLAASDVELDPFLSLDAATGEVSLTTALDAEQFAENFTFSVGADINTNGLRDRCNINIALNDLPARITSGIRFDDNPKDVQVLDDLNGDGSAEFWVADAPDPNGAGPITGSLIFGTTLSQSIAATGAAEINFADLTDADRLQISATFDIGLANSTRATLKTIADIDGDGTRDLLFLSSQPPNDGLDLTRRPWGHVVFASTIAAASGTLSLDALSATEGLSLTGPVDFNGGLASYVVGDIVGTGEEDLVISVPDLIGTGSETGAIFVVDGASIVAATGNLDFDLDASTRRFDGAIDIDAQPIIGAISLLDDLTGDARAEVTMRSQDNAVVLTSDALEASTGGPIDLFSALLLNLNGDTVGTINQADVDGDLSADLLLVRGSGDANTTQASAVFGAALAPVVTADMTLPLAAPDFNAGDYVDLTSSALGGNQDPIQLMGLGDLDGDGMEEVLFSVFENANFEPGSLYVVRGSALSGLTETTLDIDNFDASMGTEIVSVPFVFTSLSTQLSLTPDIDGDGLQDFYMTSNLRLFDDPPGLAIIMKSSDVVAALNNNEAVVDTKALFFNESP